MINGLSKNVIIQFEEAKTNQISLCELYGTKGRILSNRSDFPKKLMNFVNILGMSFLFQSMHKKKEKTLKLFLKYLERSSMK